MPTDSMQLKTLGPFEIKDESLGLVEAIVATLNVVDADSDVILPGAIKDGSKVKLSSYAHDVITSGAAPVGLATIHVVGNQARLKGQFFMNTQRGREAFETVRALSGDGEWSIGYRPTKTAPMTKEWSDKGAMRLLSKIDLVETSPVFIGASPSTSTLGWKAAEPAAPEAQADGAGEAAAEQARAIAVAKEDQDRAIAEAKAADDAAIVKAVAEHIAATKAAQEAAIAEAERARIADIATKEFERFQRTMRGQRSA